MRSARIYGTAVVAAACVLAVFAVLPTALAAPRLESLNFQVRVACAPRLHHTVATTQHSVLRRHDPPHTPRCHHNAAGGTQVRGLFVPGHRGELEGEDECAGHTWWQARHQIQGLSSLAPWWFRNCQLTQCLPQVTGPDNIVLHEKMVFSNVNDETGQVTHNIMKKVL